jgi:hypothetical protein
MERWGVKLKVKNWTYIAKDRKAGHELVQKIKTYKEFIIIQFMDFFYRPIKTNSKRLKLLRFEIWFWFRLQVKNKERVIKHNLLGSLDFLISSSGKIWEGGLWGNKPNQTDPTD